MDISSSITVNSVSILSIAVIHQYCCQLWQLWYHQLLTMFRLRFSIAGCWLMFFSNSFRIVKHHFHYCRSVIALHVIIWLANLDLFHYRMVEPDLFLCFNAFSQGRLIIIPSFIMFPVFTGNLCVTIIDVRQYVNLYALASTDTCCVTEVNFRCYDISCVPVLM